MTTWATDQHLPVDRVAVEVGSARSGQRRTFVSLLREESAATIVVEHRDRFARFGAPYLEAALSASGRRLLVVGPGEGMTIWPVT
jgi:predicted site-specific integrase-resolvase